MGNLTHWLILAGIVFGCFGIVTYSLVGRHRSWVVALPTALVLILSLTAVDMSPKLLYKITIPLTIGAAAGLVRQLKSIH